MNEQQYDRQRRFMEQWRDETYAPEYREDPQAKIEMTKELCLALHREVDELLDEVPWKPHRLYDSPDVIQSNVREEVVDIMKLAAEAAAVWGISYAELVEEFDVKSDVVDDRWRQEHGDAIASIRPIVLIDLDGVLNHYPKPFLDFVAQQTGKQYETMEALEEQDMALKVQMKHLYRQSGIKRTLPVREDSVFSCQALARAGYDLVIMSQRPRDLYARIEGDTIYWLRRQQVPYSRLLFVSDKQRRLILSPLKERIRFAVDDDANVVDRLRDLGIKTYHLGVDVPSMIEIPEVREAVGKLGQAA